MNWVNESIMYTIYPLGFCGAPKENDGILTYRLDKIYEWIPHFKKMNINAIVFNPVFESSRHGYDTIDYKLIDKRLGDNESFTKICKTLKENNIKVLLDGVFNHVGRDFFAFKDLQKNLWNSPYKDWFQNINFSNRSPYNDGFSYEGWAGHYDLVKLNLYNNDVVEYLLDAVKMWIECFDISGLRLDAADCVDLNFFKRLKATCKSMKEDFWLYGEITGGDYNRWANPETLDSVTNYECYKAFYSSHNDRNYFEFAHSLERQYGNWGIYKNIYMYNFVDNHDVNRLASSLNNKADLKNCYTMMYTMPGVPSIYYGSEWGIEGKRTPRCDYDLRPCLDYGKVPNINEDLFEHITKLGVIRKNLNALKYGKYSNVNIRNEQLVYKMETSDQCVYVAVNLNEHEQWIDFNTNGSVVLTDVLTNEKFNSNGYLSIPLKGKSGRILVVNDGSFYIDFTQIDTEVVKVEAENTQKTTEVAEDIKPAPLSPIEITTGKYRHFKGNEYEVLGFAKDSETLEKVVIYKALYGENEVWVRPYKMFSEIITVDGKEVRRFEKI